MEFQAFKLHPLIAAGVQAIGYQTPTPILRQSLRYSMDGTSWGLPRQGPARQRPSSSRYWSDCYKNLKRPSLIAYVFGEPGGRRGGLLISLYLSGGMTTALVLLFFYLAAVRIPFEATIAPVYAGTVTTAADQSATNRYTLSLRNTGEADLEVSLAVSAPSVSARVVPARVRLARGQESIQVPISIILNAITANGRQYLPLTVVIKHEKLNKELEKPVSFLLPEH